MIWENVLLAVSALRSNKMRALLTTLGIIIGITAVIAIVVVGDAMQAMVNSNLSDFGTGNITISIREKSEETSSMGGMSMGGGMMIRETNVRRAGGSDTLTSDDLISQHMLDDIEQQFVDQLEGIALNHSVGEATAKNRDLYANVGVTGVNPAFAISENTTMLSGRYISDDDVSDSSQTAVVSDRFVENMFPDGTEPIGQQVKLYFEDRIEMYTIVGVYQFEEMGFGGSTASDIDMSTSLYIPVSTAKQNMLEKNFTYATAIASTDVDVQALTDSLQAYFDKLYKSNATWGVSVSNLSSMLETINETLGTISVAIAFIAAISLLVGGIGVMNIMLVSVTERTREIGTRKALGAKNFHIRFQFVTEAVIISLIGGVIGVVLGISGGILISKVLLSAPVVISPVVVMGSVAFSMLIGIFFGLYPANRAAKLDPIEALRYE